MKKQFVVSALILALSLAAKSVGWTRAPGAQTWFHAVLRADYDYEGAFSETRRFFQRLWQGGSWQVKPPKQAELPGLVRPVIGKVSSGFGQREHPVLGGKREHQGIDLAAPKGSPILAALPGEVETVGRENGYGLKIVLKHDDEYETLYAHCDEALVRVGERVKAGQVIGRVGDSGLTTGAHLHFELHYKGIAVDPGELIK
mgnify:FL=1|jgi:murein DD-endopeptidase MepM/ murein hydrolase activator NlpD